MARKRSVDTATTAKTEAVIAMLPSGLGKKEGEIPKVRNVPRYLGTSDGFYFKNELPHMHMASLN